MTKSHKILLSLLVTASAHADSGFYLHGAIGGLLQNKPSTPKADDPTSIYKVKKTTPAPELSFGAGYHLSPKVRGEIVFVRPFFNKSRVVLKEEGETEFKDYAIITATVNSMQLRGYVDILDICTTYKVYVGVGVGTSHVRGKLKFALGEVDKFKHKYNFAYTLAAGMNYNVSKDFKLGMEYNYSYHGKARDGFYSTSLRGHSLLAKIRWNI